MNSRALVTDYSLGPRIYYPDLPDLPLPAGHRFPAAKYRLVLEKVRREAIVPADLLHTSPQATVGHLLAVHAPEYVEAVLGGTLTAAEQRRIGLPLSDVLSRRSRATVGGTLAAARHALSAGSAAQLAGGTHHAHPGEGAGFCLFNDLGVTARLLLAEGAVRRVAILDCDVHQGDGTAAIFRDDPAVLTVDMYGARNYPARKVPPDVAYPLDDGTGDADYLAVLDDALAAVSRFAPDLLLYIAGVDPLVDDRLGRLSLSLEGLAARDRRVFALARERGWPVVSVSGGGYAEPIELTVEAYANTLRSLAGVFGVGRT